MLIFVVTFRRVKRCERVIFARVTRDITVILQLSLANIWSLTFEVACLHVYTTWQTFVGQDILQIAGL